MQPHTAAVAKDKGKGDKNKGKEKGKDVGTPKKECDFYAKCSKCKYGNAWKLLHGGVKASEVTMPTA